MSKCHVFSVGDAVLYGMEKAVILYNIRFWLEKVRSNKKESNMHDGYYWTYNSVTAFCELFPYLSQGQIQRHLKALENDGVLLSGVYNKKGYDRTKWYSTPDFRIDNCVSQKQQVHSSNMVNDFVKNDEPIPYVNADVNADVISNTIVSEVKNEADSLVEFWNDNRPPQTVVKVSVWSKVIKTRLKTFTADEIKQAMLSVINSQWHQQNNQVLIKNAIDSDKRCAEAIEKNNSTTTNTQGNNNANYQSTNNQHQTKQSSAERYKQMLNQQLADRNGKSEQTIKDVN